MDGICISAAPLSENELVVVDFRIAGKRTPEAIRCGTSRLLCVNVVDEHGRMNIFRERLPERMASLGNRRRCYFDAQLARAIENQFGLPMSDSFDDLRLIGQLLDPDDEGRACDIAQRWPNMSADAVQYGEGCGDASLTYSPPLAAAIWKVLRGSRPLEEIARRGLSALYHEIELPATKVLAAMSTCGLGLDIQLLRQIADDQEKKEKVALARFHKVVGRRAGVSMQRLRKLLYEELNLPELIHTPDGNPSVGDEALSRLVSLHPVIPLIQRERRYRTTAHLVKHLLENIGSDGRLCYGFEQLGTETGRVLCSPRIDQIPTIVRRAIIARPDHLLLEAAFIHLDYSVFCALSQDATLLSGFTNGPEAIFDPFVARAVRATELTPEYRRFAENVCLAIARGFGAEGIAEQLGISLQDAQAIVEGFQEAFPTAWNWAISCEATLVNEGCVRSLYGRQCLTWTPGYFPSLYGVQRRAAEAIVQGTISDIKKYVLQALHEFLPVSSRILFASDDSIVIECPGQEADHAADALQSVTHFISAKFSIPLMTSIQSGMSWADCRVTKRRGSNQTGRLAA